MGLFRVKFKSLISKIIVFSAFFLISIGIIAPVSANAQNIQAFDILGVGCLISSDSLTSGGATVSVSSCNGQQGLLNRIIRFLRDLSIPLAILVICWGGYQYFIGGFDGKSNGKNAITSAIIGIIIVLIADFLINSLFGSNGIIGANGQFNVAPAIAFIRAIITALAALASTLAILVFTWGGYKYFFSGLDFDKKDGAESIKNGVLGLLIVLITYSAFDTVANLGQQIVAGNGQGSVVDRLISLLIEPFVKDITGVLFNLSTAFAIFVVMWGGYKYYFAGSGMSKEDGLKNIRNGLIGLIAILVASGVVTAIRTAFRGGTATNPIGFDPTPVLSFITLLTSGILLPISAAVSVFYFVLAGFYYTTSAGDEGKAKKAQSAIKNSVIGLLITLFAATIVAFIRFIFGAGVSI
jgi:Type IV secretion system pilin